MSIRNPISKADCPEGEDEGDLEECKTVEKNSNGCCTALVRNGEGER